MPQSFGTDRSSLPLEVVLVWLKELLPPQENRTVISPVTSSLVPAFKNLTVLRISLAADFRVIAWLARGSFAVNNSCTVSNSSFFAVNSTAWLTGTRTSTNSVSLVLTTKESLPATFTVTIAFPNGLPSSSTTESESVDSPGATAPSKNQPATPKTTSSKPRTIGKEGMFWASMGSISE